MYPTGGQEIRTHSRLRINLHLEDFNGKGESLLCSNIAPRRQTVEENMKVSTAQ